MKQIEEIRRRVLASIDSIRHDQYRDYDGHRGLKKLAEDVKARGRRKLKEATLHPR